jgi:sec-independent protein translocase protein TatB
MLRLAMFGMGGSEIIVILIVALLFLGPDKLPQAAKSISKGIRDIKKQSRALQQQIESDEQIGGAIRDLKSALRGDDLPIRPKPYVPHVPEQIAESTAAAAGTAGALAAGDGTPAAEGAPAAGAAAADDAVGTPPAPPGLTLPKAAGLTLPSTAGLTPPPAPPGITLPPTAGEADPVEGPAGDDDLASMIKPASGTVAKTS